MNIKLRALKKWRLPTVNQIWYWKRIAARITTNLSHLKISNGMTDIHQEVRMTNTLLIKALQRVKSQECHHVRGVKTTYKDMACTKTSDNLRKS